jgi:hypothetical protein
MRSILDSWQVILYKQTRGNRVTDPSIEYKERLASRQKSLMLCARRLRDLNYLVRGTGFVIAATLWAALGPRLVSMWLVTLPVAAYTGLVIYRDRLYRKERGAKRAVMFYDRGLVRVDGSWEGSGNTDTSFIPEDHLYAADLDLFGKGSLFELMCTARTRAGQNTLARWLCESASREEILKRHEAIEELRANVDLREDIASLGPDTSGTADLERIAQWAAEPPVLQSRAARMAAPLFVAMLLVGVISIPLLGGGLWLLAFALVAQGALGLAYRNGVQEVMSMIDEPAGELNLLYADLTRLERERFSSSKLSELQSLLNQNVRPRVGSLLNFVSLLRQRRQIEYFWPLSFLLLWATQFTFAIEAWRLRNGPALMSWFNAFGEIEALCAIAGYAFEHPDSPFPEIVEERPLLEGEDLRHPLLPRDQCVSNSVGLTSDLRMLVVSGSNMSGKSTYLRTVGINVVLAQAGAPVHATRLRLSLFSIGATLRIQDSLQGGTSRFYAEIRRVHSIMSLSEEGKPVLFLLDEILHGTNSHDRAIGAEGIVRGLLENGAIGLVTTHDLALAKVADALAPRAQNVHFEDHMDNGEMVFDYRLRLGVIQNSNALALMRAVGLKV